MRSHLYERNHNISKHADLAELLLTGARLRVVQLSIASHAFGTRGIRGDHVESAPRTPSPNSGPCHSRQGARGTGGHGAASPASGELLGDPQHQRGVGPGSPRRRAQSYGLYLTLTRSVMHLCSVSPMPDLLLFVTFISCIEL